MRRVVLTALIAVVPVTVASELHLPIQRRAKRMLGFSEDHVSILRSSEVSTELNGILAEAAGS